MADLIDAIKQYLCGRPQRAKFISTIIADEYTFEELISCSIHFEE
jgi:hypothetical protein